MKQNEILFISTANSGIDDYIQVNPHNTIYKGPSTQKSKSSYKIKRSNI